MPSILGQDTCTYFMIICTIILDVFISYYQFGIELVQIIFLFWEIPLYCPINILWNHFYSWGAIFVDCRNFVGLCRHNFTGNLFVALQCQTIHYFVKGLCGRKYMGRGNPWNPLNLNPPKQWWFHGILFNLYHFRGRLSCSSHISSASSSLAYFKKCLFIFSVCKGK